MFQMGKMYLLSSPLSTMAANRTPGSSLFKVISQLLNILELGMGQNQTTPKKPQVLALGSIYQGSI